MIGIGHYRATIKEHSLGATPTGTMYVNLVLQIGDDLMDCRIWLTNKTIHSGLAQRQLAKCGFEYNTNELESLQRERDLLKGIVIPISVAENEYHGRTTLQCNIDLDSVTSEQVNKVQDLLRKVKAAPEEEDDIPF